LLRAALFDMDGLLVDTEMIHWEAWKEALNGHGIHLTFDDYAKNFGGKAPPTITNMLAMQHNLSVSGEALWRERREIVFRLMTEKLLSVMPHAKAATTFFVRHGIRMAVVSGGARSETVTNLNKAELLPQFERVASRDDADGKGKPGPAVYVQALKQLGLRGDECVAFEDTQYGVESAAAAGVPCVAVQHRRFIGHDFSKSSPFAET